MTTLCVVLAAQWLRRSIALDLTLSLCAALQVRCVRLSQVLVALGSPWSRAFHLSKLSDLSQVAQLVTYGPALSVVGFSSHRPLASTHKRWGSGRRVSALSAKDFGRWRASRSQRRCFLCARDALGRRRGVRRKLCWGPWSPWAEAQFSRIASSLARRFQFYCHRASMVAPRF